MAKTRAQENRAIRQEALREQLANQKLVEKVLDISRKLTEPDEPVDVQRLKAAADINLKLINKYLPDVRSMELTGEGGSILDVQWTIEVVSAKNDNTGEASSDTE